MHADYFECIVLVEKLILTGLLIFCAQGTVFQAFGGCCVAFGFFAVQTRCWPYRNTGDNWLKCVAEVQLSLTLLVSIILRTELGKDVLTPDGYGTILVLAFFSSPSVATFIVLRQLCRHARQGTGKAYLIEQIGIDSTAVGSNVEEQEEGDDNGQPMTVQSGSSEASSTQMHVADVDKVEV